MLGFHVAASLRRRFLVIVAGKCPITLWMHVGSLEILPGIDFFRHISVSSRNFLSGGISWWASCIARFYRWIIIYYRLLIVSCFRWLSNAPGRAFSPYFLPFRFRLPFMQLLRYSWDIIGLNSGVSTLLMVDHSRSILYTAELQPSSQWNIKFCDPPQLICMSLCTKTHKFTPIFLLLLLIFCLLRIINPQRNCFSWYPEIQKCGILNLFLLACVRSAQFATRLESYRKTCS